MEAVNCSDRPIYRVWPETLVELTMVSRTNEISYPISSVSPSVSQASCEVSTLLASIKTKMNEKAQRQIVTTIVLFMISFLLDRCRYTDKAIAYESRDEITPMKSTGIKANPSDMTPSVTDAPSENRIHSIKIFLAYSPFVKVKPSLASTLKTWTYA